jgi:hypothetical protein
MYSNRSRKWLMNEFTPKLALVIACHLALQGGEQTEAAETLFQHDAAGNLVAISNSAPGRPALLTSAQGQSAFNGEVVSLSVSATGGGPLRYQWLLNGVAVAGATNDSLLITNASAALAGRYTAIVSNASGSVTSAPALVAISPATNVLRPRSLVRDAAYTKVPSKAESLYPTMAVPPNATAAFQAPAFRCRRV